MEALNMNQMIKIHSMAQSFTRQELCFDDAGISGRGTCNCPDCSWPPVAQCSLFSSYTEDWSNDLENSALITGINYILRYIHTENLCFKL